MFKSNSLRDIFIVGRSCRLPGAADAAAFWRNLAAGRASIREIGADRWDVAHFHHPRLREPGRSYTFKAGTIDNVWGFDAAAFGISPREALQMDPQQRLALELVAEALEDGLIRPSAIAAGKVGVYAGASGLDHSTARMFDAASADAYFMIGNTLSLISNRVSHAFDLRGPSLTIDTACSSSLVALHHACEALRGGSIEMAVVVGVNMLLSPFPFIGFSQASMLAPDGACRPFDADGRGYVRAEGGVALILTRGDSALVETPKRYARIVATGVNSDGHTVGVSLPSAEQQARLLEDVYGANGVGPEALAFVEAHGTGTRAGDPAEATALGRVLGQRREAALPIGSVKSNIGHLEPASGVAGLLKAMLALEHDLLPASLNFTTPNPDIPFSDLNLRVVHKAERLPRGKRARLAGISTFGFGGTNAHVIIADAPEAKVVAPKRTSRRANDRPMLVLSAMTAPALRALAGRHAALAAETGGSDAGDRAATVARTRDLLPERAVFLAETGDELVEDLKAFADGAANDRVMQARATGGAQARAQAAPKIAFVFSGNGSQWAGMGRSAYMRNAAFRAAFDEVDALFAARTGWSLREALEDEGLEQRLTSTLVAQPLLFAVQVALARALAALGVMPQCTAGHSVGEIAAAYVAGALPLETAVRIIEARSACQEPMRGAGVMAAVRLGETDARAMIASLGLEDDVEVAAVNSARSVTVVGTRQGVEAFQAHAQTAGTGVRVLDIAYPFHSRIIETARQPLLKALAGLEASATAIAFVSTVTGDVVDGASLDAGYWWRNVRAPVQFREAITAAARMGARLFVEIGPRPVLQSYLGDCLSETGEACAAIATLTRDDVGRLDPVRAIFAKLLAYGVRDARAHEGPMRAVAMPAYPWQRETYRAAETPEAVGQLQGNAAYSPLLGWQAIVGGEQPLGLLAIAAAHVHTAPVHDRGVAHEGAHTAAVHVIGRATAEVGALRTRLQARLSFTPILTNGHANGGGHGEACDTGHAIVLAGEGTGLQEAVEALAAAVKTAAAGATRLWAVSCAKGPLTTAMRAMARTAANEYADLDIRFVEIVGGMRAEDAADKLADIVHRPPAEREIVIAASGVSARRVRRGGRPHPGPARKGKAPWGVLAQSRRGQLDTLTWQAVPARKPAAGEVIIKVTASGLNFRDVMWAQGLLPEEALEDGFAGPSLGFECAGEVVATGADVTNLKIGDRVMALAADAFATHVVVPASAAMRLPESIDAAGAATVPVAFMTAYYALEHLARPREGEWVLIHGGAGGVGLAALQIVRRRGARTILTAGTEEKRALLEVLGADHVLSSRSLAFGDEVMRTTGGKGVDVVLNSLAGEAMDLSLRLVRAFGRFVELGKRDYYANTKVGLRPFRRNVSYFGVDLDQLVAGQPELAQELMGELAALFADETFRPLPYRAFEATRISDAFRLMQQSGHIGKIIVTRPEARDLAPRVNARPMRMDSTGWHVVTGGLSGFGLATAGWLADRGARRLALVGRSGRASGDAQVAIEELRARGIEVKTCACDVADAGALDKLLAKLRRAHPIKGVVHAAMVLDDAVIAKLDSERIATVLRPKADGAANLDRLTRGDKLDYFLMYSSVTTLVGNAGQAAYVAANAYLEGLAQQRRAEGLPACAVRWGAIADTGVLARNAKTGADLARRAGATGLRAREALDMLAAAMAEPGADDEAVLTVAPIDWGLAAAGLAVLKTPLFRDIRAAREPAAAADALDLDTIVPTLDDTAALTLITRHLKAEMGAILRLAPEDIDAQRSLADLGMDSLMAMELRLAVHRKLGIELPITAIADGLSVEAVGRKVLARIRSRAAGAGVQQELAEKHAAELPDAERLQTLIVEIDRTTAAREAAE